ncbi:hypothetical protein [Cupriavidus sp. DL-D2]|uniref:hypothetical protein n=1 Tax=Cupriavidus sp. DL-D2 TaxID=3144974 RepID=UPI003212B9CF
MKLIAEMALGNSAFEGPGGPAEAARILRKLADELEAKPELQPSPEIHPLRDVNGNRIGIAYITDV